MFERGTFCAWIRAVRDLFGLYSVVNQFRKVYFGYSAKLMLIIVKMLHNMFANIQYIFLYLQLLVLSLYISLYAVYADISLY